MSIKRMKEFAVRKILGATVAQIFSLNINYFLCDSVDLHLIALPLGYLLIQIGKHIRVPYRCDYLPFLFIGYFRYCGDCFGSFSAWKPVT